MLEALKDKLQRRRDLREVEAMTETDLADIGLSRAELEDMVTTDGTVVARQMEMAWRHGVTNQIFGLARHDHVEIVRRCRDCGATDECRSFLADPSRPASEATFCPNAKAYDALAATRD